MSYFGLISIEGCSFFSLPQWYIFKERKWMEQKRIPEDTFQNAFNLFHLLLSREVWDPLPPLQACSKRAGGGVELKYFLTTLIWFMNRATGWEWEGGESPSKGFTLPWAFGQLSMGVWEELAEKGKPRQERGVPEPLDSSSLLSSFKTTHPSRCQISMWTLTPTPSTYTAAAASNTRSPQRGSRNTDINIIPVPME